MSSLFPPIENHHDNAGIEDNLFEFNLLALFACKLDELSDSDPGNISWKLSAIQNSCKDNELRKYMKPWLESPGTIHPGPILSYFRERENEAVEARKRTNRVRSILERIVRHGVYDSRVRVGLKKLCTDLKLNFFLDIAPYESFLAQEWLSLPPKTDDKDQAYRVQQTDNWSWSRIAKVTGAAAVGGTLMAVTAGAIAPFIAPVAATLFATTTAVGVGVVTGLFGVAGAGLTAYKMADRTKKSLNEFFFLKVTDETEDSKCAPSLHLAIGVSGTIKDDDLYHMKDFWAEAVNINDHTIMNVGYSETYFLVFDRDVLLRYSITMLEMLEDHVLSYATKEVLSQVVGHAIIAAASLPLSILNASSLINNSFVVCEARAEAAGKELAYALRSARQGARPVSLFGFSFGAFAIFYALEQLAKDSAFGIIEDVLLAGVPLRITRKRWINARRIVAGKFINAYCPDDWSLKLAMEFSSSMERVAGVRALEIEGIEDVEIDANHVRIGYDGGKTMKELIKMTLKN